MDIETENRAPDSPVGSTVQPNVVRITVINNSQIISGVARAATIVGFIAALLVVGNRFSSPGLFRNVVGVLAIGFLAVSIGLLILSQILDRALRRCPVCRRRITSKTEESRRCLECDTELWGYWDE